MWFAQIGTKMTYGVVKQTWADWGARKEVDELDYKFIVKLLRQLRQWCLITRILGFLSKKTVGLLSKHSRYRENLYDAAGFA